MTCAFVFKCLALFPKEKAVREIRSRSSIGAIVMVFGILVSAATPAAADSVTCTSSCNFSASDSLDDLFVNAGGVAMLDGTRVTGNIVVEDGGAVYAMNGVRVEGNVQSFGGSILSVLGAVVGGNIQVKNTPEIQVEDTMIGGDLQLEENTVRLNSVIASNVINGNLQLFKNELSDFEIQLQSNDVLGNLQLVDNRGGTIRVIDNYVESSLQCTDNDTDIRGGSNMVGDLECTIVAPEPAAPDAAPGDDDGSPTEGEVDDGRDSAADDRIGTDAESGGGDAARDDFFPMCGNGVSTASLLAVLGLTTVARRGTNSRRRLS